MQKLIPGQKVIYKGQDRIVQTSVKDFSTQKTVVHLQGDNLSNPILTEEIKQIKEKKSKNKLSKNEDNSEILELRAAYLQAVKKEVPANKKNDIKWMSKKIEEAWQLEIDTPLTWDTLKATDNLKALIADRELDIDIDEYEHADDIRVAIATELDIDIPEDE